MNIFILLFACMAWHFTMAYAADNPPEHRMVMVRKKGTLYPTGIPPPASVTIQKQIGGKLLPNDIVMGDLLERVPPGGPIPDLHNYSYGTALVRIDDENVFFVRMRVGDKYVDRGHNWGDATYICVIQTPTHGFLSLQLRRSTAEHYVGSREPHVQFVNHKDVFFAGKIQFRGRVENIA